MAASAARYKPNLVGGNSYIIPLKRVALNAVRIVTGKNSIRHTMRDAVLDVRVLADILDHMPVV